MSIIICPRCKREIDTLELWVEETKDGMTCVECLTEEEHSNDSGYHKEDKNEDN